MVALDRAGRFAGAEAVEGGEQRFLRPRLARRAGDADDPRAAARARRDTERIQRRGAVRNADMRMVDGGFAEDAGGTRSNRLVDEFVPVGRLTLHRAEEVALSHPARIEGANRKSVGTGKSV